MILPRDFNWTFSFSVSKDPMVLPDSVTTSMRQEPHSPFLQSCGIGILFASATRENRMRIAGDRVDGHILVK